MNFTSKDIREQGQGSKEFYSNSNTLNSEQVNGQVFQLSETCFFLKKDIHLLIL